MKIINIIAIKHLDYLSFNSGNTLDLTLEFIFKLYTTYRNDSILIDYGDSSKEILSVNSSKF